METDENLEQQIDEITEQDSTEPVDEAHRPGGIFLPDYVARELN